jgi:broad specificity polyphosphatase/5'/3'-nucleotidase SurE
MRALVTNDDGIDSRGVTANTHELANWLNNRCDAANVELPEGH